MHKDNPIKGLTMQQVDAIFSATRLCGSKQDVKTWGDLGLTGDWAKKPVQLFGRNSVSGTYGYFRKKPCAKATSVRTSTSSRVRLPWCSRSASR